MRYPSSTVGVWTGRLVASSALILAIAAPAAADPSGFPTGGTADYQLGTPYAPAAEVTVLVRDSTAGPAAGVYNVCYVNGFQTQPGDTATWLSEHPELVLTVGGDVVADPGWPDEVLFDTSTPVNRAALVRLLTPTLQLCAGKGFQAVEFDNLDSFTRSRGALTADDNLAFARELVAVAHGLGLDAGQKNAAEFASRGPGLGFDFAIAEECLQYDECGSYTSVYGDRVIDVEYTDNLDQPFAELCERTDRPAMTILRDRDLTGPRDDDFAYEHC